MTVYDVTGIGNAIVDVLAHCDDDFLTTHNIEKGAMTLIDEARAKELYNAMGTATEASGGSAANTMAGIASFGGRGGFIGLVANDQLGDIFAHDTSGQGITFNTPRYIGDKETARCYVFITPDGERSMNTFLGACTELSVEHIDRILISSSQVTLMEGYLFDKDPAKEAYFKAATYAHESDRKIALTLSDSFCVERHKRDFQKLVKDGVDIVFGNEKELCALFETDDIDAATRMAAESCDIVVSTRGADGVYIATSDDSYMVAAPKVEKVIDLTGAGDQLAAGFLYGLTHNMPLDKAGLLGVKAAAEVITHVGPRPHIHYTDFLDAA